MTFSTCDLCDEHATGLQVAEPLFRDFGRRLVFGGEIVTVKCHEDNSVVKELVATSGDGRVMVVDGGGSLRRALLGDQLAAQAARNKWSGLVIYGAVRDVQLIAGLDIGVKALNAIPVKTEKRGIGDRDVTLQFAGVTFTPGDFVYSDPNGLIVSSTRLV